MFITNDVLQDAIIDAIKQIASDIPVPGHIANIASASNTRAYNEIQRRLITIGYSQAQIDGWDHGAEYQRDLGLYFAFVDESINGGNDTDMFIKLKDRRDEVSAMPFLIVNGARSDRGSLTAEFGYGPLDTTQDEFVRDTNDCRRGQITRW